MVHSLLILEHSIWRGASMDLQIHICPLLSVMPFAIIPLEGSHYCSPYEAVNKYLLLVYCSAFEPGERCTSTLRPCPPWGRGSRKPTTNMQIITGVPRRTVGCSGSKNLGGLTQLEAQRQLSGDGPRNCYPKDEQGLPRSRAGRVSGKGNSQCDG